MLPLLPRKISRGSWNTGRKDKQLWEARTGLHRGRTHRTRRPRSAGFAAWGSGWPGTGCGACSVTSQCRRTGWPWCLEGDRGESAQPWTGQRSTCHVTRKSCLTLPAGPAASSTRCFKKNKKKTVPEASQRNVMGPALWQLHYQLGDLGSSFFPSPSRSVANCIVGLIEPAHRTLRRVTKSSHAKCPSRAQGGAGVGLALSWVDRKGAGITLGAEREHKNLGIKNGWTFTLLYFNFSNSTCLFGSIGS